MRRHTADITTLSIHYYWCTENSLINDVDLLAHRKSGKL
jgi:hypothetical protein